MNAYYFNGSILIVNGTVENSQAVRLIGSAEVWKFLQDADGPTLSLAWFKKMARWVDVCEEAEIEIEKCDSPKDYGATFDTYLKSPEEFKCVFSRICSDYDGWLKGEQNKRKKSTEIYVHINNESPEVYINDNEIQVDYITMKLPSKEVVEKLIAALAVATGTRQHKDACPLDTPLSISSCACPLD